MRQRLDLLRKAKAPDRSDSCIDLARRVRELRRVLGASHLQVAPSAPSATVAAASGTRVRRRLGGRPSREPLPALGVVLLNRLAYGPRPGDLEAFASLGGDDAARWQRWVEAQLHPATLADDDCDRRLAAAGFTTLGKSQAQLWQEHHRGNPEWWVRVQPLLEVERATFLRAVYSQRQLAEVLVEFWHDHFNIYAWDYIAAPTWAAFHRDAIRGHLLGNFRAMLGAVAKSPAMLVYLDNWSNHVAGPNENYARELFELHTLGRPGYLGVRRQAEVPRDALGRPVGYVDDDVYEATRCLTGWTFDEETGAMAFPPDWHDRFQKWVLGRYFPPNRGAAAEGEEVLDLLAFHPATARHIAWRLCRRLVADDPPQPLVEAAAAEFLAAARESDQLARVVRVIALSPYLYGCWGLKVKRPFEAAVSALCASGVELGFAADDETTDAFLWLFEATGHARFAWHPPDGYPDRQEAWLGTGSMVALWRLLNWLVSATDATDRPLLQAVPAGVPPTSAALADWWIQRIFARSMDADFRREIVAFLAQGRGEHIPLPVTTDEATEQRLRAMVGVLLMSPQFLWR